MTYRTVRVILRASGFRDAIPLLVVGLILTVVFHDGMIDQIGPLVLSPAVPVMVAVPLVLAVAVPLAHASAATPVIVQNARVRLARGLSYLVAVAVSLAVVWLGDALSFAETFDQAVRNLLVFGCLTLAAGVLLGSLYAWVPAVLLFGSAVVSPVSDSPWTAYGLVFGEVSTAQFAVLGAVGLAVAALAVWDPVSAGYLRRAAG